MARKTVIPWILSGLIALSTLVICASHASGCGSPYYYAVFTYTYPDYPLDAFARGSIGVINPGSARSYLYVAYRYLSNKPFNAAEQNAVLRLWDERLNEELKHRPRGETANPWLEARKAVPGSKPVNILIYAPVPGDGGFDFFVNVTADAFRVAAETLKDRVEKFGAENQIVRDWLAAQDIVFSNPAKESQAQFAKRKLGHALIPDPPGPGLPPLARADRMYQRACAHFYAGNYGQAAPLYREIVADTSSPWSQTARFMIARCLLRKVTLMSGDRIDWTVAGSAEAELKQILRDENMRAFHASAARLRAYLRLRTRPEQRLYELSQTLTQAATGENLFQDLWDYTVLLDRFEQATWRQDTGRMDVFKDFAKRPEAVRKDDMTDWIFTFQSVNPKSLDHALARWRQTKSLPWLVSCLTKMRGNNPSVTDVLSASEKISSDSPGFVMVAFHRARLLAESGNRDKASGVINEVLLRERSLSQSTLNLLFAEKAFLAKDLDDFLSYASRKPAAIILWSPDNESEVPEDLDKLKDLKHYKRGERLLDADTIAVLNRDFSLDLLKAVAISDKLDANIRREVALRAWTRAVLIGRDDLGQELARVLEELVPEIKGEDLRAYVQAKGQEARRFAAAYLLLKTPGLTPIMGAGLPREIPADQVGSLSDYGRWWCARPSPEYGFKTARSLQERAAVIGLPLQLLYPDRKVPVPAFLTRNEKQAASKEWQALSSLDTAPNLLAKQVLAWAQSHPDDPRVPEALHLAVRATRYGCADKATSELSKKTFQMLHRRYPKSDWTAKTKHWY